MNTEIDKKVIGRFYEALEVIISRRAVGGIQPYCELYGIDKRNLYAQRKNPDVAHFHFDWILPMVTTYGISATWLLTGEGDMFVPFFNSMPVTTRKRRVSPSLSPSLQDTPCTPPQTPQITQKPAVNTH